MRVKSSNWRCFCSARKRLVRGIEGSAVTQVRRIVGHVAEPLDLRAHDLSKQHIVSPGMKLSFRRWEKKKEERKWKMEKKKKTIP